MGAAGAALSVLGGEALMAFAQSLLLTIPWHHDVALARAGLPPAAERTDLKRQHPWEQHKALVIFTIRVKIEFAIRKAVGTSFKASLPGNTTVLFTGVRWLSYYLFNIMPMKLNWWGKHSQSLIKILLQKTKHLFLAHSSWFLTAGATPTLIPAGEVWFLVWLFFFFLSTIIYFKYRAALDGSSPTSPLFTLRVH